MYGLMLQELCEKYNVSVVPTFVAFKNENKVSFVCTDILNVNL